MHAHLDSASEVELLLREVLFLSPADYRREYELSEMRELNEAMAELKQCSVRIQPVETMDIVCDTLGSSEAKNGSRDGDMDLADRSEEGGQCK